MDHAEQNNPAGRLHAILLRAIEATNAKAQSGSGITAADLWAVVFDIPISGALAGEALLEIISRVLQVNKLIDETEANLRNIENLPERYFRPFNRIRAIPRHSLIALTSADMAGIVKTVAEGDMITLEFCSERLAAQHAEPIIDPGELEAILVDIDALFDGVQESNLDIKLKTFILDCLESIRRSIFEFRIRGHKRLKETLAETIGTLMVNHDVIQAARTQDESTVQRFEKVFYRLAAVVSFAVDGPALLSAVNKLLPGG